MRLSLAVAAFLIAEQCNAFSLFTLDPIKRHHTSLTAEASPAAPEKKSDNEEGAGYDGTGGMGLAKGTANTWIIPGMDEMSPEEYQEALQKSDSDRQALRQEAGIYGNRATNDYLNNLSGKKSGGMIK
jgi:hypothetical protein